MLLISICDTHLLYYVEIVIYNAKYRSNEKRNVCLLLENN